MHTLVLLISLAVAVCPHSQRGTNWDPDSQRGLDWDPDSSRPISPAQAGMAAGIRDTSAGFSSYDATRISEANIHSFGRYPSQYPDTMSPGYPVFMSALMPVTIPTEYSSKNPVDDPVGDPAKPMTYPLLMHHSFSTPNFNSRLLPNFSHLSSFMHTNPTVRDPSIATNGHNPGTAGEPNVNPNQYDLRVNISPVNQENKSEALVVAGGSHVEPLPGRIRDILVAGTPGPVNQKPRTPGPVNQGPMTPIPVNQKPRTPGPVNQGPRTPRPVNQKPRTPGPVNQGPRTPIPVNQKPRTPGPLNQEPRTPGPANSRLMTPVPVNQGPMTPIPVNQKPRTSGPVNQKSTTSGPLNQESRTPGPVNHGVRTPGPVNQGLRTTGPVNQEQWTSGPVNQDMRTPRPVNQEQWTSGPVNQDMRTPGPVNQEQWMSGSLSQGPRTPGPVNQKWTTGAEGPRPAVDRDASCYEVPIVGECRGAFKRYHYNATLDQCDCHFYGGCDDEGRHHSTAVSGLPSLQSCWDLCLPGVSQPAPSCTKELRPTNFFFTP
ncbi:histone-lysine N-methyltransferase 2C-like [Hyalella azteca]|uniref:Histone-lysine N-methyltransferase 2C-like n=1 Tax=Hyalella azteca TaxID=294128 RepID=A0A8B7PEI3_HYAAZ|nr:histone-lysine N-methyltransferase 2C-like [Hyalella azteca]